MTIAQIENFARPQDEIQLSLKASAVDGVFATIFTSLTGGVLVNNFLIELQANPTEIGLLSSIPMLVNLLQPLGAYISEKTDSRRHYGFWIFAVSRSLWLILAVAIIFHCRHLQAQNLILVTLIILSISNVLGAFGSASWMSWMASLVPESARGRYFGFRNSAVSLTNLLVIPLGGWLVATWGGGSLEGFGVVILVGLAAGWISLAFQNLMKDVNPQTEHLERKANIQREDTGDKANFYMFAGYISLWMFAVNVSAPFFNLYLLKCLDIDLRWVTLYNSASTGAYLLMMMFWGSLSDRIGNRSILIGVGIVVAVTPLLWLGTGNNSYSLFLVLPLLHLLTGGTWAGIDLCVNNLQLGIVPVLNQARYFAIIGALGGAFGAFGTTIGGILVQVSQYHGLSSVFILSAALRLLALVPLFFLKEKVPSSQGLVKA
ncbi:MAG: hypothetical protein N5P05_001433 [Chroococcopsis gigantea SAG 12.99]|jgi:MFS family permease|nr:MFS transporter [Chlorogloea purpurea SAG 13.99]MDV2999827.1 hypothetical protein [Chroococcopsis gigantea SAG 12.99]